MVTENIYAFYIPKIVYYCRLSRKRNRVRKVGTTPEYTMRAAIKAIKEGKTIRTVAKEKKISYSSLRRYFVKSKGGTDIDIRLTPNYEVNKVFSAEQEEVLKVYLKRYAHMFYGLATKDCRKLGYEMAVKENLKMPPSWSTGKIAGLEWYKAFKRRHPDLKLRRPETCTFVNTTYFNLQAAKNFFENLELLYNEHPSFADGTRVFNLDETASSIDAKPQNNIDVEGINVCNVTSEDQGSLVTTCCTISAAGAALPPVIIFPTNNFKPHMIDGAPTGTLGLANESGLMNETLFVETIRHFIKHSASSKDNPSLLILDNHQSHRCIEALDLADDNGVTLLTLHPHITAKMQPLEMGIFSSFESYYDAAVDSWRLKNPGKHVTMYELPQLIGTAFAKVMTPTKIINAFTKTGIFPLNKDIYTEEDSE